MLLVNKKHAELLQHYEHRATAAAEYVRRVRPDVAVQTGELTDPMVSYLDRRKCKVSAKLAQQLQALCSSASARESAFFEIPCGRRLPLHLHRAV